MKKTAKRLNAYLNDIGFCSIYKYLSGFCYFLSPVKIKGSSLLKADFFDKIYANKKENLELLKCLLFCSPIKYKDLQTREKEIADELIRLEMLRRNDSIVYSVGFQIISTNDLYLMIDCKHNFSQFGQQKEFETQEVCIGAEGCILNHYIDLGKINKKTRCLDIGTGIGIIGLSLSRLSDNVVAIDVSDKALFLAEFNKYLNNRDDKLTIKKEDLKDTLNKKDSFDIIVSNLPFSPFDPYQDSKNEAESYDITTFFKSLVNCLSDKGTAYLFMGGFGDERQPTIIDEFEAFCEQFKLSADIFVTTCSKVDKATINHTVNFLKRESKNTPPEQIEKETADFFKKENVKFFYASVIVLRRAYRPCVRCFNPNNTHPWAPDQLVSIVNSCEEV